MPPESRTAAFLACIDVLQKAGLGAGRDGRHSLFWLFALCFGFEHIKEDD